MGAGGSAKALGSSALLSSGCCHVHDGRLADWGCGQASYHEGAVLLPLYHGPRLLDASDVTA